MKIKKIGFFAAIVATVSMGSLVAFRSVTNTQELPVDKALYEKFLGTFTKVELPYTIKFEHPKTEADVDKMYGWDSKQEISGVILGYEFSKFIPALERGYMSRMGPDDFYTDGLVAKNDKFSAIIYKRRPNYQSHVSSYVLATFDKTGKMISQRTIASCYADYFEEPTIDKDLKINIAHYKANYLDNKDKEIKYDLEKSENLHIDANGAIVAATEHVSVPKSEKADLKTAIQSDLWSN